MGASEEAQWRARADGEGQVCVLPAELELGQALPPGISLSASPGDDPKAQLEAEEQGLQAAGCIGHQRARFSSRAQVLSHCL